MLQQVDAQNVTFQGSGGLETKPQACSWSGSGERPPLVSEKLSGAVLKRADSCVLNNGTGWNNSIGWTNVENVITVQGEIILYS